jgi:hypothetical protein
LTGVPAPSPGSLTLQSGSKYKITSGGDYTLQPGVYNGGISISSQTSGSVTLMPGIYYMQGGGFSVSGGMNVTGSGVMIYNAPSGSNDQVTLSGTGTLTLSPPTSGSYKGITIFQSRTSTAAIAITGNGSLNVSGTIYAPGAEVDLTGNGSTDVMGAQFIANNMKVGGNGSVNVTYDANSSPVRDTRIVQ